MTSDIDIKEQTEDISSEEASVATPTNAKKASTEQDEALAAAGIALIRIPEP